MIIDFKDKAKAYEVGNKAFSLIDMKKSGFNVPDGFVIDSKTYETEIEHNNCRQFIGLFDDENVK